MNGVPIKFTAQGPSLDFSRRVAGFAATVQNALVNCGTRLGSDLVYPTKGTTLQTDGAKGAMSNLVWAQQRADFAALRTLAFVRQMETSPIHRIQKFQLKVTSLRRDRVGLRATAVSDSGEKSEMLSVL